MRKKLFYLIFLTVPFFAFSWESPDAVEYEKTIFFLILPKSGTHLLKKMLCMLLGEGVLCFTNIDEHPYDPPEIINPGSFIFNHVYPGFSEYKEPNPEACIKVILIRDPRDIIVSFFYMLKDHGWRGERTPSDLLAEFRSSSEEEMIAKTMMFPDEYLGMKVFFREAIEWMQDPNVFVLRFEDIVGPEGGGDRTVQERTFRALLDHLEIWASDEEIAFILDHAFGPEGMNGTTFRKGEIGNWPQYFTDDHKELFKLIMGEDLIRLGYEKDNNW